MKYTRRRIDAEAEVRLATGMIISDRVCQRLVPVLDLSSLKVSYIKVILKWVIDYFRVYSKAPMHHIRDIFESEKKRLDLADVELMEEFLVKISDDYVESQGINPDYVIDRSLEYLEEISLEKLSEGISEAVKAGRTKEAQRLISNFKKFAKKTSRWINIFDPAEVGLLMHQAEDDFLFEFPGALGELVGPILRGYFGAILAPIKRGKTWMLMETAIVALMNHLKVVFVSLEMKDRRMAERFYKRLVSSNKTGGIFLYPVFDCVHNQLGDCQDINRASKIKLIYGERDDLPEFEKAPLGYVPCSYCRERDEKKYEPAIWYIEEKRLPMTLGTVRKKVRAFSNTFAKDNFRLICYPRFSAGIDDLERDIDMLEFTEDFVPDVIIVDYIDILARGAGEFRHAIDEVWMSHARMASLRSCFVLTATQSTRKSWDASQVRVSDSSENYRNPAHVDLMLALNQAEQYKERGMLGVSVVAHRDLDFNPSKQVTLLQKLDVGQPFLDSEWYGY